ncbi:MAG: acyltransferase [Gammaproteobacteria bacterium]|nr:acyltransferase [Gammaproteobacteria bacterium]
MGRKYWKLLRKLLNPIILILRLLPYSFICLLYNLASSIPTPIGLIIRYCLLASKAAHIGSNVYVARWVTIKNITGLNIGDNVSIHENCYIDAIGDIIIGDDVSIAHNSSLISFEHTWTNPNIPIKYNRLAMKKVSIANDVWIGCGVRVLGGTIIHTRSILAAGCVAKGNLVSGYVYGGIPAKKIMELK